MWIEGSSVNHVLDLVGFVVASAGVSWAQVGRSQKAPTRHPLARSLTATTPKEHAFFLPPPAVLPFPSSHLARLSSCLNCKCRPPFLAPRSKYRYPPSVSTGHPHLASKNCTTADSHTYLSLPIAPHLSQHPIISASFMTGSRCGTCALSPARLPPPRVRSSSSSTNPGLGLSPNTYLPTHYHCVTHPRTIVSRRTIHVD